MSPSLCVRVRVRRSGLELGLGTRIETRTQREIAWGYREGEVLGTYREWGHTRDTDLGV